MNAKKAITAIAAVAAAWGIGYYVVKRTTPDNQETVPAGSIVSKATAVGAKSMGIY